MAEVLTHAEPHDEHDHKPHGWRRWVFSTNHKDIGTMYLVFACLMFFIGGGAAMLIRLELFSPGCSSSIRSSSIPSPPCTRSS